MRCQYLWNLVLTTAALAVSATLVSATDPDSSTPSETTELTGLANIDAKNPTSTPPKTDVPTRAKHKPDTAQTPPDRHASRIATTLTDEKASTPAKTSPIKIVPKDEPLEPIPDAMESGPVSIEAASFKGVIPGVSTQEDVVMAWGQPKEMVKQNDRVLQLYSVDPFDHVEVCYSGDKVASLLVRFERAFPAAAVAKQLDLISVRPVLVSNELGESLGLAYPERGVLFVFVPNKDSDSQNQDQDQKPSMQVAQLILEPITAEPFVLRAETVIDTRCDLCRRDLEQALAVEPDNARAQWLHARVLLMMGQYEKAAVAAGRAVQLESNNPNFRVTHAQALAQAGRLTEAIVAAKKAAETGAKRPHVKAKALCLLGDLTASGPKPDFKKAIALHTQALQIADPLASDPHPAIRVAAKEVLIDAHLGAAHDIAWGDWKEKSKAVSRWLERALAVADDLVQNDGGSKEQLFRVYIRAMSAYVGIGGKIDAEPTVNAVVDTGNEVIAAVRDPLRKAQLQWDLGLALYDAVQISQMQSEHKKALKFGEQAAEYLAKANETKPSSESALLLGRLYFRLGTIHALGEKDHKAAVAWYNKAIPLLNRPSIEDLADDIGRHGESFVSMGVSYWEIGQQKKAVALSEKGIEWMEQAVKQNTLNRSSLTIPYNNLSAMHRKLGSTDKADRFHKMAGRIKEAKLK